MGNTFVIIQPDAFNESFNKSSDEILQDRSLSSQGIGGKGYRRPVRGIQIKEDTYATIQVRKADGTNLLLFDAAADGGWMGTQNSNFLIQSIQEQRAEKQQIVLTFGEPYIFFFGEQPRILQVEGILLNTEDFNWRAEWWKNYDEHLRGTQCVRSRTRVVLSWDDIVVQGYIISSNANETSQNPNFVTFQFQMFLTNYENISSIGDPLAHLPEGVTLDPTSLDKSGYLLKAGGKSLEDAFASNELYNQLSQGSSTLTAVREENLRVSENLEGGVGKNSMLQNLRDGAVYEAMQQGLNAMVEIQGQMVDILAEAGQFISGRNIRVPLGFEGSAVYDDAQVALASLPASAQNPWLRERTVTISAKLAGQTYLIQGSLGAKTQPARYGGLYLNADEFVSRVSQDLPGKVEVPELYKDQQAEAKEMVARVRKVFKDFKIDTDPPREVDLAAQKAFFGIFAIASGAALGVITQESGTARFLTNLL
jgi:hypothetical protein